MLHISIFLKIPKQGIGFKKPVYYLWVPSSDKTLPSSVKNHCLNFL